MNTSLQKQSDGSQNEGSYNENTDEETSEEENPEEEPTPFADCYPQGELIPYGLHLLQSFDGASFEELPVKRVETTLHDQDGSFLFDEQFEAAPSTDCRYLKVQLKQFSRLPYLYADGVEGFVDVNMPHLSHDSAGPLLWSCAAAQPGRRSRPPARRRGNPMKRKPREEDEKKTVSSTKKSSIPPKAPPAGTSG